jgi:hypothetical protein
MKRLVATAVCVLAMAVPAASASAAGPPTFSTTFTITAPNGSVYTCTATKTGAQESLVCVDANGNVVINFKR